MGILAAQSGVDIIEGPRFSVAKDSGKRFMARAELAEGTDIQQAHFDGTGTIKYSVRNSAGTEITSGTLTATAVVFDTLQTDAAWTQDSTGYNFAFTVPAAAFATVGFARVEFEFTPDNDLTAAQQPAFGLFYEGTVRTFRGLG